MCIAIEKARCGLPQSTNNSEENGYEGLWESSNVPTPTGAIWTLQGSGNEFAQHPEEMAKNLYLANGLTMDRSEEFLFVSESMMDRILRFRVEVNSVALSDRETYHLVPIPDNLAIDKENNLWVASPMAYQISVIDHRCRGASHSLSCPYSHQCGIVG